MKEASLQFSGFHLSSIIRLFITFKLFFKLQFKMLSIIFTFYLLFFITSSQKSLSFQAYEEYPQSYFFFHTYFKLLQGFYSIIYFSHQLEYSQFLISIY